MTRYIDITLDLETASTKPNAAIVQIGAFCLQNNAVFNSRIGLKTYGQDEFASKFAMDADTQNWWLDQDSEVREYVFSGTASLAEALSAFNLWISVLREELETPEGLAEVRVWGNGVNLDNTIIEHAYYATGIEKPWNYRGDMCYRTLAATFKRHVPKPEWPQELQKHRADHDAIYEGEHLKAILVHAGEWYD